MIHHGAQRQPREHLTARLALKLLEDTLESSHSSTTDSPTSPIHRKTVSLQCALGYSGHSMAPTAAAEKGASLKHDLSDTTASSSFTATTNSTSATHVVDSRTASFGSSDESSVASWEEEDDGFVFEDRDRLGAADRAVDYSIDDTLLLQLEQRSSSIRQQPSCNKR